MNGTTPPTWEVNSDLDTILNTCSSVFWVFQEQKFLQTSSKQRRHAFSEVSQESEQSWTTVPPKGPELGLLSGLAFSLSLSPITPPTWLLHFLLFPKVNCLVLHMASNACLSHIPINPFSLSTHPTGNFFFCLSVQISDKVSDLPSSSFQARTHNPSHWLVSGWVTSGLEVHTSAVGCRGRGCKSLVYHPSLSKRGMDGQTPWTLSNTCMFKFRSPSSSGRCSKALQTDQILNLSMISNWISATVSRMFMKEMGSLHKINSKVIETKY